MIRALVISLDRSGERPRKSESVLRTVFGTLLRECEVVEGVRYDGATPTVQEGLARIAPLIQTKGVIGCALAHRKALSLAARAAAASSSPETFFLICEDDLEVGEGAPRSAAERDTFAHLLFHEARQGSAIWLGGHSLLGEKPGPRLCIGGTALTYVAFPIHLHAVLYSRETVMRCADIYSSCRLWTHADWHISYLYRMHGVRMCMFTPAVIVQSEAHRKKQSDVCPGHPRRIFRGGTSARALINHLFILPGVDVPVSLFSALVLASTALLRSSSPSPLLPVLSTALYLWLFLPEIAQGVVCREMNLCTGALLSLFFRYP